VNNYFTAVINQTTDLFFGMFRSMKRQRTSLEAVHD